MTTIQMMVRRGQIPKPDTLDGWEELRAAKRAKNVANAREVLKENWIPWCEFFADGLVRFEIPYSDGWIMYYPEEGRWYLPRAVNPWFGLRKLVKRIKGFEHETR